MHWTLHMRSRFTWAIIATIAVVPTGIAIGQSPYRLTKVVDGNTSLPGAPGMFSTFQFGSPSLDSGSVTFSSFSTSPFGWTGVYRYEAGALQSIADESTTMPGGASVFDGFSSVAASSGNVAFVGSGNNSGGGIPRGVYFSSGGALTEVASRATHVPGVVPSDFFRQFNQVVLDGNHVAFSAEFGSVSNSKTGIYSNSSGTLQVVADTTMNVPGTSSPFSQLAINGELWANGDSVLFSGSGGGKFGIFSNEGGAVQMYLDQAAFASTAIPNGTGNFSHFTKFDPDGDDYAVVGLAGGGAQAGVYTSIDGNLSLVADRNTIAPGLGTAFTSFGDIAMSDGSVVFTATGGVYTNVSGTLEKVLGFSDLLDGKTIQNITAPTIQGGDIAFGVSFTDGSRAIYLSSYNPSDVLELIAGNIADEILGGTNRLGGIEFEFENAAAGNFSAAFSISRDQGLLQPGSIVAAGEAFQIWDLDYDTSGGTAFDSALLTLNYNPLLVDGNLIVYHQFDGQSVALGLGTAGSLGLNQYAILGDGLLQVRISHFSNIVVTGQGGAGPDPDPQPVPEPSSLALLSIGGLIGALRLRRRRASE